MGHNKCQHLQVYDVSVNKCKIQYADVGYAFGLLLHGMQCSMQLLPQLPMAYLIFKK